MKTIVFIHGMFQNPKSWDKWVAWFTAKGYNCVAPAWPMHEGEPADLRENPPAGLGELKLQTVIDEMERVVRAQSEPPIVIGHSVGGLITQLLVAKGLVEIGVPIDSVAPNAMLAVDWGFMKNSTLILNPLKGDEPFFMDLESFHGSFCNTMTMDATKLAYDETATHDSRNVLRDCLGEAGQIDTDLPHAPLLFIGGEKDEIIPASLNKRNSEAFSDEISISEYREFENRGHWICGQEGWEDVAGFIESWLQRHKEVQYHTSQVRLGQ
ncbi:hypothetical protein A0256_21520 [Mucilaginibacter sp. PAMC 26640]|nr:hypothetical protein A0256_21520 [Mucilaginibacter sp. PAMC 26640]